MKIRSQDFGSRSSQSLDLEKQRSNRKEDKAPETNGLKGHGKAMVRPC